MSSQCSPPLKRCYQNNGVSEGCNHHSPKRLRWLKPVIHEIGTKGSLATTRPSNMELKVLKRAVKTTPIASIDFMRNIDMSLFVALTPRNIQRLPGKITMVKPSASPALSRSSSSGSYWCWTTLIRPQWNPHSLSSSQASWFSAPSSTSA